MFKLGVDPVEVSGGGGEITMWGVDGNGDHSCRLGCEIDGVDTDGG